IGKRGAALFLLVIFILGFMVIAAFSVVITDLLVALPSAVIPSWGAIGVALLVGVAIYKLRWPLIPVTVVGAAALCALTLVGDRFPVSMPDSFLGLEPTACGSSSCSSTAESLPYCPSGCSCSPATTSTASSSSSPSSSSTAPSSPLPSSAADTSWSLPPST